MKDIKGAEQIQQDYGYLPTFEHQRITRISMHDCSIELMIQMEDIPKGFESYAILITFHKVYGFELRGELLGYVCILSSLEFKKEDFFIGSIHSSKGVKGKIKAKDIQIKGIGQRMKQNVK